MAPVNKSALNVQHGGKHYKSMAIQPVEYGMANAYDPCAFSTMKYVSRHGSKNGEEDLNKAIHFVDLRLEMLSIYAPLRPCKTIIRPEYYCRKNGLGKLEFQVLHSLHIWALGAEIDTEGPAAEDIKELIREIIKRDYWKRNTA